MELMCTTFRTEFNVRAWYEVENSLSGVIWGQKKIVPRVTYLASAPKRLVKFHIFSVSEIDKSIFTRVKTALSISNR